MSGRMITGGGHCGCWFVFIKSVGWCGGKVKVRVAAAAIPTPPPATNTTSTVLWPVSFFTIDSSLNNHYSQLDKKWVESAGPLIPDQYLTITYQ